MKTSLTALIITCSAFSLPGWGSDKIMCVGNVEYMASQTLVIFEKEEGKVTVRYPDGLNLKSEVRTIWSSANFLTLSTVSDSGVGVWLVNKKTKRFSYMQSKDLTGLSAQDFNFDQYVGGCNVLSGSILSF